ncbi:MAG: YafY family transcriptional regulator [Hyphomonadaceae bacterium]|nr:YafY family transcriptional regulator [Hyphomonadaceae bacterium]
MRAGRLLSMLILLQMRGRLSAEALAAEFEVSVRTIYRDIDQLSAAGVPVYAERGRNGGFALHEGYRTRLTGFTPAEAEALLLAGVGDAASALGVGAEAAAAQLKLLASLPQDAGASAQQVAQRFHIDPIGWYARAESIDLLPTLAGAVWRNRRIRIRYESWKEVVNRDLDPLGLVLKGGLWYLVAAARGKARTYRVANIQKLDVLEAQARAPTRFDLARYWKTWAADFEARLLSGRARVKLSPLGFRLLRDTSPAAAEAARQSQRASKPEGWIEADIPVEEVAYAARQMLRLGAEATVLGPPELRAAVAGEAARVAGLYAKPKGRRRAH